MNAFSCFEDAVLNDQTVCLYGNGMLSAKEALLILANRNRDLTQQVGALELIVPKRMRTSDGVEYIYHTPGHLIPITHIK